MHVCVMHVCKLKETISSTLCKYGGPGSVVGIATGYRLDGLGIKSRWGARFSAPLQTGPGAHPASCRMGNRPFPGVKSSWGMMLTPHPMGCTACTESQCLYKGALYLYLYVNMVRQSKLEWQWVLCIMVMT